MVKLNRNRIFHSAILALLISTVPCSAVTSKITRHSSQADFVKGKTKNVVLTSQGTIQLSRDWAALLEDIPDAWAINCIAAGKAGELFIGTSPNGCIFKYVDEGSHSPKKLENRIPGKLTKIYPRQGDLETKPAQINEPYEANSPNEPAEPNAAETGDYFSNEHIFAMAIDNRSRLLAGVSGASCKLLRFADDEPERFPFSEKMGKWGPEVIFEPNQARGRQPEKADSVGTKYIFAISLDKAGNIYLGTGPDGMIYYLDAAGENADALYQAKDKNILSLAIGTDGFIYAGSDQRGLIYKVNPSTKTASVLYDADQPEITGLFLDAENNLYAAGTSASVLKVQEKSDGAISVPPPGRPESEPQQETDDKKAQAKLELKVANIRKNGSSGEKATAKPGPKRGVPAESISTIYKISKDGFVSTVFRQAAVFLSLACQDGQLLIGTGNKAQLFTVNPQTEQSDIAFEDSQASQITTVSVFGDDVYLGTANPAKLIRLSKSFAAQGVFSSDLIDAGQPAIWGKLQLDADIPEGCSILCSSRSGNVKDVNDPTFSPWTEPVEITAPAQLLCPLGRFCQYKLILKSSTGNQSPIIREVAVAYTVPNVAPKVTSVTVTRVEAEGKQGLFKISYKANDDNGDKLIYKIDFRKLPRTNWIEIKDQLEAAEFEWDSKTVEDGRYEIRVTADDQRSNTTTAKLTGTRISEAVVVDNTAPAIEQSSVLASEKTVILELSITDELSAIASLDYTIDSNAEWKTTLPGDSVYDTTTEHFSIIIKDLSAGQHVIAVKVEDAVGNTLYKTFDVEVRQE